MEINALRTADMQFYIKHVESNNVDVFVSHVHKLDMMVLVRLYGT